MRKKDPDKRRQILVAAAKLILTGGLNDFSTTKVAKAVGIAQSNVYLYYPTKAALLQALLEAAQQRTTRYYAAHQAEQGTLTQQVLAYLDGMIGFAQSDPNTFELLHALKADASLHPTTIADQAPADLLTAASQAGLLRPVPPAVLMAMVFNVIRAAIHATADLAQVRAMLIAGIFMPERMPHAN